MDEKELDKLLNEAANIPLPKGLEERLSENISRWESAERKSRTPHILYWSAGIAAAAALAFILLLPASRRPSDTFSNPYEAAIVANQALSFMAKEMNKGVSEVNRAGLSRQMDKGLSEVKSAGIPVRQVDRILNKHLKQ
jgi:hypothetical protein